MSDNSTGFTRAPFFHRLDKYHQTFIVKNAMLSKMFPVRAEKMNIFIC